MVAGERLTIRDLKIGAADSVRKVGLWRENLSCNSFVAAGEGGRM